MAALTLEIESASAAWNAEPNAEACVRTALAVAAKRVPSEGEVSVLLADDAAVRSLNRNWRGFDKPTNVLSFPAPKQPAGEPVLGDIAIAYETVAREAA